MCLEASPHQGGVCMEHQDYNDMSFEDECSSSPDKIAYAAVFKNDSESCAGCGDVITDRYLLHVSTQAWHARCLRCYICQVAMDRHSTCFIRDGQVYCKLDYAREFGVKCARCCRTIQSSDWVRRAKQHVYHLACFACDSCQRQLSTGEEFAVQDGRLLCKTHYTELVDGGSSTEFDFLDGESSQKSKAKRIRTTFSEEQVQVLQANFQLDSNPDGQDLERIAQITGLSKRVTQVWFQNSRARQKKHQQQQRGGGRIRAPSPSGSLGSSPPPTHTTPPHWRNDGHSSDGLSFSD